MNNYRTIGILALTFLAGILVVTAGVLWVSQEDRPPIQVIPPPTLEPSNGGTPAEGNASSVIQVLKALKVYVSGAVVKPGVYTLQEGDRLVDAVDAAGGATSGADLSAVNLALRVADERYYYIPELGELPPPAASPLIRIDGAEFSGGFPAGDPAAGLPGELPGELPGGLIDLNTAPLSALLTLPGIGNVRAQLIIDFREQNGPFKSVSEVTLVPGIGKTTYGNMLDLVTVGVP